MIAVTKSGISDRFGSCKFEEFSIPKGKLTIVFDTLLSKISPEDECLSVIESPLISCSNPREIILSQAKYYKDKGILEVSKPLVSGRSIYYHLDSEGNFYCSTHISMLRQTGVRIRENVGALPEFFVFRFTMAPLTLYDKIWQLNVGSRLRAKWHDGKCKIEAIYEFNPPSGGKDHGSFKNFREKASDLLIKSIEPFGVSQGRLAVLLSGGLDSSLLLKTCQNLGFDVSTTYSTGYPFEDFEREYAQSTADYFGTSHSYHEIEMKEYLPGFIEAISLAEQPLPHMQSVLIHLLFKDGLPENKDIVLNGAGAELSCNGTSFSIHKFLRKPVKLELLKLMGKLPIVSNWQSPEWAVEYQSRIDCPIEDPKNIIWSQDPIGSFSWASEHFDVKQGDIIKNSLRMLKQFGERSINDTVTIYDLLGGNNATQSSWSMLGESQKRIVYYPFNDSALVDYFFSIPEEIKFKEYKHVLKEVARDSGLPDFIINRRKLGFNPLTNLDLLKEKVFEPLIPIASKVFDEQQIRKVKPINWGFDFWTLWNMLNYSVWKRLWINNEPAEVLLEELIAV